MSTCMSTSIGFCGSETSDGIWPFPMCSGTRRGDLGVSGDTILRVGHVGSQTRRRRHGGCVATLDLRGHPTSVADENKLLPSSHQRSFFEFSGRTATPESRSLGLCPPRRRYGARAPVVGKIRTLKTF
jgi:hypothetical protein